MPELSQSEIKHQLQLTATEIGFSLFGVTAALGPATLTKFENWLDAGLAGEMSYLKNRRAAYSHTDRVLPHVRSVVMLATNYSPVGSETDTGCGKVARYAVGQEDYHHVLRRMLKQLADRMHELVPGCKTRGVVDTAPLLERDFAQQAGLGWFGKNTMLINKQQGSYFFLSALLSDIELPADEPHHAAHCGTCTRCLEACPTDAFTEPYVLDARRCLSYFTIELRDRPVPAEFRESLGDWLFGCDICQEVCPWNRKAGPAHRPEFAQLLGTVQATEFLELTDAEFEQKYGPTPLSRPGRTGMARNAAYVLGNSGNDVHWEALKKGLSDSSPLVRGACVWAIGQIGGELAHELLRHLAVREQNATVQTEIQQAMEKISCY